MKLIEAITAYMKTCPHLKDLTSRPVVNVDKVDEKPVNYSISPVPISPTLKNYVNGDKQEAYQYLFLLRGKTDVIEEYVDNHKFYENLSDWMDKQTENNIFPDVEDDKEPEKIETIDVAYLSVNDESGESAVYQITCQFIYRQKGA